MTRNTLFVALLAPAALALGAARFAPAAPVVEDVPVASAQQGATRYVVTATGNEARFRVRERLAIMELPYDAVGKTTDISGGITFTAQGAIVPAQSKITVDVRTLKSDQERRDGYVQRNLLQTAQYPTVVFEPTEVRGLNGPIPTSGSRTFQLVGNMTVKDVKKPAVWNVTAQFLPDGRITGNAEMTFTFADFNMTKPTVGVILSLADELKLEYDFALIRQQNAS